jgi:hypothetical protein
MTRINANIPPRLLSDHHLIAEQKEIARLPLLFQIRLRNDTHDSDIPKFFTLGTGHILFFMNKGKWARERANLLRLEMIERGLEPRIHDEDAWAVMTQYDGFFDGWRKEVYIWGAGDNILVINRIIDKMIARVRERKDYGVSYYGKKEHPAETIKRLLKSI